MLADMDAVCGFFEEKSPDRLFQLLDALFEDGNGDSSVLGRGDDALSGPDAGLAPELESSRGGRARAAGRARGSGRGVDGWSGAEGGRRGGGHGGDGAGDGVRDRGVVVVGGVDGVEDDYLVPLGHRFISLPIHSEVRIECGHNLRKRVSF